MKITRDVIKKERIKYQRYFDLICNYDGDEPKEFGRLLNALFISDIGEFPIFIKNL